MGRNGNGEIDPLFGICKKMKRRNRDLRSPAGRNHRRHHLLQRSHHWLYKPSASSSPSSSSAFLCNLGRIPIPGFYTGCQFPKNHFSALHNWPFLPNTRNHFSVFSNRCTKQPPRLFKNSK